MLVADQPAGRLVIIHDAGRIAVDAHLLFKTAARDRIAVAQRAVLVNLVFRHDEKRDALDTFRAALDARQHEVNDVLGQVLLAAGNPDLLAGDLVAAIALRDGLGLDEAKVGAALWLGQIHRAGPFAGRHFRAVELFLLIRTARHQRLIGAGRQARIHGKGHIGRRHHLADGNGQRMRQALSPHLRCFRQERPAIFDKLLISIRKAIRRLDRSVIGARAALLVADLVQREEDLARELSPCLQDLVDDVRRRVGEALKIGVILDGQDIVKDELHVPDRCVVTWHFFLLSVVSVAQQPARNIYGPVPIDFLIWSKTYASSSCLRATAS